MTTPATPTTPPAPATPAAPAGHRLFLGLHVSVATAGGLAAAADTLARRAREARLDVRWVAPASYHLTLKYVGWVRADAIEALRDAAGRVCAATPPIAFRAARLDAFPSVDRASVVWADVVAPAPLIALGDALDEALGELGIARATRPLVPHITLGRVAEFGGSGGAGAPVKELLAPLSEQMFSETRADALVLFESIGTNGVSSYKEVARILFKAAEVGAERQTRALDLSPHPNQGNQDSLIPDTDDGWPRGHLA
jgi:2'-5' RNA ligase